MADLSEAAEEFRDLAKRLIEVGADDLKRELYQAVNEAGRKIADEIKSTGNLREHMPNRYADVLAGDLKITVNKRTGVTTAGVVLVGRAPTVGGGGRKVAQRDTGILGHPVFGMRSRTNPRRWAAWVYQTAGMHEGFFTNTAEHGAPEVREQILQAMRRIADKAVGKG